MEDLNYRMVLKWAHSWANAAGADDKLKQMIKKMLPPYIKAAKCIDKYSKQYEIPCVFVESSKVQILRNALTWTSGSPNINLIKLTFNSEYTYFRDNPRYGFWKDEEIDPNIISKFKSFNNNRFPQPDQEIELPENYDLFFLQIPHSKDRNETIDALKYCKDRKIYTLFKGHPTSPFPGNKKVWDKLKEEGYVSEYSIYVEAETDFLIKNARRTYSSTSVCSLNSILQNKITATYNDNDLSEIVPTMKTAYELDDVEPIKQEDIERYLSWYYHKLCIDVYNENCDERIEKRILNFKNKVPMREFLS